MDAPRNCLCLHPDDDVLVALRPLIVGEALDGGGRCREAVRAGHKLARRDLEIGEPVRKFGQVIGAATRPIAAGEWVHTHNLAATDPDSRPHSLTKAPAPGARRSEEPASTARELLFQGYPRPDGHVGTRNYLALVATVNCSSHVVREAARQARERLAGRFEHVDGIFPVTHPRGCGLHRGSPSHRMMDRVLAGTASHPNVGAHLVVGLGCEKGQAEALVRDHHLVQVDLPGTEPPPPAYLNIQDLGGTEKTIAAILEQIERLLPRLDRARRKPCPLEKLILGTQCGGSDGLSGISANPAIGLVSDAVVAAGGRSVFAETTETFGAASLIASRARRPEVGRRYLDFLEEYRQYLERLGADFHANTATGNFEGGITTLPEKALGSVMKSGQAPLEAAYDYAEPIDTPGLGFMNTPAFDPASCTAINAGGANLGLFSTGRGSCSGFRPVPWIKISSNTPLFEHMPRDIDFDAGPVAAGRQDLTACADELLDLVIRVASGQPTWSERHGYGDDEFVLWDTGPMT